MGYSLFILGLRASQVRFVACVLAGLQVLSPVVVTATEVSKVYHSEKIVPHVNNDSLDPQYVMSAGEAVFAGSGAVLRSKAAGMASGAVNAAAHEWFSPYGTMRSSVNVDPSMKVKGSSLDVLIPFYDDQKSLLFTQFGIRNEDDRNTLNMGAGVRVFNDNWMQGANVFLDNDFSGNNRRIGIGLEAWTDYLKLSANSYFGVTNWHQSRDFADYNERPANGWDVRMEGWLPAYPQLGTRLAFEQYYGNEVALSSRNSRAKNPSSVTGGLTWTPVPLVTFGGEHRIDSRGETDGQIYLELTYRPGVSFKKQMDSSAVAGFRTLAGSRTDLVERNNKIVLDYKKQDVITLGLPKELEGVTNGSLAIVASVSSKYALKTIDWQAPQLINDGGSVKVVSPDKVMVTLPGQAKELPYTLTAVAHDIKGNVSQRKSVSIRVADFNNVSQLKAVKTANPSSIPSDGTSTSQIRLSISDIQGRPVSGLADQLKLEVDFQPVVARPMSLAARSNVDSTVSAKQTVSQYTEVSAGLYEATVTAGKLAGVADVVTTYNGEVLARSHITLTDNSPVSEKESSLAISVLETGSVADGVSANRIRVVVTDGLGKPVPGSKVSFSADTGALSLSSETTDKDGSIIASLTSTTAGTSTVTAVFAQQTQSASVTFFADEATAAIASNGMQVLRDGAVANGTDSNSVKVTVSDANGNPLSGVAVHFTASNGATLAATAATGADGTTTVAVTSTTAGSSSIRATVNGAHSTVAVTFVADLVTLKPALSVASDFALADGKDRNEVVVTVTDANGNPAAGQAVQLTADSGASIAGSVTTDVNGQASTFLTSTKAGSSTVTAVVAGQTANIAVTFLADEGTAAIASNGMQILRDGAVANGTDSNRVQVTVGDANGNPLSGVAVHFTANNGATLTATGVTAADGTATVAVTSVSAGNSTIRATVNGAHSTVAVTFVADLTTLKPTLSVESDFALADGKDRNEVIVTVTDANGNPIAGQTVQLSADNSASIAASVTTDTNGQASTFLTSTKAGNSTVTAVVAGQTVTVTVTFLANEGTAAIPSNGMQVLRDGAVANGTDRNRVQVTVSDANGNPLSGMAVHFTASNGATLAASGVTATDGTISVAVSSITAGGSTIQATVNGAHSSVAVTFVADLSTLKLALSVESDFALADGSDRNEIAVAVNDAHGNPIAGQVVQLTADNGASIAASVTTDVHGQASTFLTSTKAGNSTVTAVVAGQTVNVTVTFLANEGTAAIPSNGMQVLRDGAVANGIDSNRVQVTVNDANGNPLSGMAVHFTASNGATLAASGVTATDGTTTVAVSSTIQATVNGVHSSVAVTFVADLTTLKPTLSVEGDFALADGSDRNEVVVTVTDAHANPIAGQVVQLTADNGASIAASVTTDVNGQASTTLTSTTAGNSTVTAVVAGQTVNTTVTFLADEGTATIPSNGMQVLRDGAVANGTNSNSVKVTVNDANGNPLSGVAVHFTANHGATLAASDVTAADGTTTVAITSTTAGSSTIRASVNGAHSTVAVTFVADPATLQPALSVVSDLALADGKDRNEVVVTVKDAHANPIAGQTVQLTADNGASIAATATTNVSGQASTFLTSTIAGSSKVTAVVAGQTVNATVTFIADEGTATIPSNGMQVLRDGAVANGTDNNRVQVKVNDANGNPLSGVAVHFTASNGATLAASGVTGADGTTTVAVTSTKAGSSTIRATVNGAHSTVAVTFVADLVTLKAALSVASDFALADGKDRNEVVVTVKDAHANPIAGQAVQLTADNGASIAATVTTDVSGQVSTFLTSTIAGSSKVTAVVAGQTVNASVTFIADEGTATIPSNGMQVLRDGAVANGADSNSVKVTVNDANGNPLSGVAVNFTADHGATLAASGVTGTDGTTTVAVTSTKAGSSTIRATVNGAHSTVAVTFVADLVTLKPALSVASDFALADGKDRNEVVVTVKDAHANPIAGQVVQLTADNGASIAATVTTDVSGQVSTFLTSTVAGSSKVTAVVAGQTVNATVSFIADEGTAAIPSNGMQVLRDGAVANGTDSNSVQVKVIDANGNPLTGMTVHFAADNGATIAATGITGSDGVTTLPVTSLSAGSSTIRASVNGGHSTVAVTFVAVVASYLDVEASQKTARVGEAIALTVKALDSSKKPLANAEFSLNVTDVRNRKNSVVTSGVLKLDGVDVNPTQIYKTNASGVVVLTVTDPLGTGVSRELTASSGAVSAGTQLIFTVATSPDSPLATMWGHMSDSIKVGNMTFLRPELSAESSLSAPGNYAESGETWSRPAPTHMATLCPISPSVDDFAVLYAAYPNEGIKTVHGWPVTSSYHTSTYSGVNNRLWFANGTLSLGGPTLRRFVSCRSN